MANAGVAARWADTEGCQRRRGGPTSTSTRSSPELADERRPVAKRLRLPTTSTRAAASHARARAACRHHATVATAAALTVPEVVELVEVGVVGERAAEAAGQLGSLVGSARGRCAPGRPPGLMVRREKKWRAGRCRGTWSLRTSLSGNRRWAAPGSAASAAPSVRQVPRPRPGDRLSPGPCHVRRGPRHLADGEQQRWGSTRIRLIVE